jgi:azurin
MNFLPLLLVAAIFALCTGCGRSPEHAHGKADAGEAASAGGVAASGVGTGTSEAPREVLIEVGDHMRFSVTRIEAAAGETLRVRLVNTGTAPKEAMGHNWVLLKSGTDVVAYANAALGAKGTDYVPVAKAADVIAHTKLLGGGGRDAVVFTVPADASAGAELVYLCTFPAHLQLGMKGLLVVR